LWRGCYSPGGLIMQDYGGTFEWRRAGGLFQAGRDTGTVFSAAVRFFPGKAQRRPTHSLGAWRPWRPKNNTVESTVYTNDQAAALLASSVCIFSVRLPHPTPVNAACSMTAFLKAVSTFRLTPCTTTASSRRAILQLAQLGGAPQVTARLVANSCTVGAVYQQKGPLATRRVGHRSV
jgi:hypothetical protein